MDLRRVEVSERGAGAEGEGDGGADGVGEGLDGGDYFLAKVWVFVVVVVFSRSAGDGVHDEAENHEPSDAPFVPGAADHDVGVYVAGCGAVESVGRYGAGNAGD